MELQKSIFILGWGSYREKAYACLISRRLIILIDLFVTSLEKNHKWRQNKIAKEIL